TLGVVLAGRQFLLAWRVMSQPEGCQLSDERAEIDAVSDWPGVTILVPAHNEERVLAGCLAAMCALDYPEDKLSILVIDDRSTDRTRAIAEELSNKDGRVRIVSRAPEAVPGKAAAIAEGMAIAASDILV